MLFRQLFDPETSTYTYLIADPSIQEALLVDPVVEQVDRDRRFDGVPQSAQSQENHGSGTSQREMRRLECLLGRTIAAMLSTNGQLVLLDSVLFDSSKSSDHNYLPTHGERFSIHLPGN